MDMSVFRAPRDRPPGPSDRTKVWVEFIEEHADWFIGARKRWHEGDPTARAHRLGLIGSGAGILTVVVLAVERLVS
jgi:hypothetical protein